MFISMAILTLVSIAVTIHTANRIKVRYPYFMTDMSEIGKGAEGVYKQKYFNKIEGFDIINYDAYNELKALLIFGISLVTTLVLLFATLFLNTFGIFLVVAFVVILQISAFRILKNDYETFVDRFIEWKETVSDKL